MNYSFFEESTDCSNEPISDGFRVVRIPQASITANLPSAVPVPPEMIAPACPILFPAGAVTPAIKPTTGFFILFFTHSAAVSSSLPPISPIMTTASVSGSLLKSLSTSICFKPFIGSPPIPMSVDCPKPKSVICATAS